MSRLLVITQKVDQNDPDLGFFHVWLEKLAQKCDHLYIICLQKGEQILPRNVTILSLGKEEWPLIGRSRWQYVSRFCRYIFRYRKKYDGVFVHMNPEYAILGGVLWRWWHKKILFWYTHKAVNLKLRIAEKLVHKIFTPSPESFRLPSAKVEIVGHGIPVSLFAEQRWKPGENREFSRSGNIFLLSVGRIAPVKGLEIAIRAIALLQKNNSSPRYLLDIVGAPITKKDIQYQHELARLAEQLQVPVNFAAGGLMSTAFAPVRYGEMPRVYQQHDILVHLSKTGSIDKVVLEALAAGRIVLSSSEAFGGLADGVLKDVLFRFTHGNFQELANTIEKIHRSGIMGTIPNQRATAYVRDNHNLDTLIGKIVSFFT